ncbi:MAG TPA: hypothetical protein VLD60_01760 [Nitrospira sp.]|nr:hypothetical protein [Nitrospira sp.]
MGRASISWDYQFLSRPPDLYRGRRMGLKKIGFTLTQASRLEEYQVSLGRRQILARRGCFASGDETGEAKCTGEYE